jgi:hypothetical protein
MAKTIRQIGLRLVVALTKLCTRRARAGWKPSHRGVSLRGR